MSSNIKIHPVTDPEFRRYGRVVAGYGLSEMLEALRGTPLPTDGTVYVPS